MRALIPLILALVPASIIQSTGPGKFFHSLEKPYAGRGHINPPTIAEMKQIDCLATMVYGEARGESQEGKVAVAYTALNRAVKSSVCDVVLAPKQYSIFNDNPALRAAAMSLDVHPKLKNVLERRAWETSLMVAHDVFRNVIPDPTNGSTHYLAPVAMKRLGYTYPKWSKEFKLVAVVDNHHFYRKTK